MLGPGVCEKYVLSQKPITIETDTQKKPSQSAKNRSFDKLLS